MLFCSYTDTLLNAKIYGYTSFVETLFPILCRTKVCPISGSPTQEELSDPNISCPNPTSRKKRIFFLENQNEASAHVFFEHKENDLYDFAQN